MDAIRTPVIDYTNKDYASLREAMLELASEKLEHWTDHSPNDLGVVLLELFAYMGDILLYYQDRIANESYLETAEERRSVLNLLRLIGYELRAPQSASADLNLLFNKEEIEEGSDTVVITQGTEFTTTAEATGEAIRYQYVRDEPFPINLNDLSIIERDGKSYKSFGTLPVVQVDDAVAGEIVATSDGSPSQRYALDRSPLAEDSLQLYVNGIEWQRKSTLLYSRSEEQHYMVRRDESGIAWVEFGDGRFAAIPPRGVNNVTANYRVGGGEKGNVPPNTITKAVTNINFLEGVYNELAASGGTGPEATEEATQRAPQLFRSMGRAVTAADYEAHALNFGVGKARARATAWNTIEIYVAPKGGGTPTDTLKNDILAYFEDKRMMTSIVDIRDPDPVTICLGGKLDIDPYYFTEQVQQKVATAIANLFAFDNVDFEQTIYISKIYEAIEAVEGVVGVHKIAQFAPCDATEPLSEDGVLHLGWEQIPQVGRMRWEQDVGETTWKWWTEN